MKKLLIRILIIIIVAIVLVTLINFFNNQKSNSNINGDVYTYSKEIEDLNDLIYKQIKDTLKSIDSEYKESKKNNTDYIRADFSNDTKLNEIITDAKIEFVNVYDIDLSKVYMLNGQKDNDIAENMSIKFNDEIIDFNTLDTEMKLDNGKIYFLRAEYGINNLNLYYLVMFSNSGVKVLEPIFYTINELIELNEDELNDNLEESL